MKTTDLFDLSGKVALITGAARGIGKTIALAMADMGADIVVVDILQEQAEAVVREVEERSRHGIAIAADLTSADDVSKMMDAVISQFGRVDILVNNAGITNICRAEDYPLEDFQRVTEINTTGLFYCTQAVGRQMIKQGGGRIVNLASVAGFMGAPPLMSGGVAYHSSKSAVIGLTRQFATEWGEHGIYVNAICPGIIATDLTRERLEQKEFNDILLSRQVIKRLGRPEDLVGIAVYLSSEASSGVTGQTFVVDGGYLAY